MSSYKDSPIPDRLNLPMTRRLAAAREEYLNAFDKFRIYGAVAKLNDALNELITASIEAAFENLRKIEPESDRGDAS